MGAQAYTQRAGAFAHHGGIGVDPLRIQHQGGRVQAIEGCMPGVESPAGSGIDSGCKRVEVSPDMVFDLLVVNRYDGLGRVTYVDTNGMA